ncbi:MAG: chromosome partitioning protein [Verrucomicrobiales bacterium]|jgi:chromosome partitioning protein
MGELSETPRAMGIEQFGSAEAAEIEIDDVKPGRFALAAAILSGVSLIGLAALKVFDESIQKLLTMLLKDVGISAQVAILAIVIVLLVVACTCGALAGIEVRRRGRRLNIAVDRLRMADSTIKKLKTAKTVASGNFESKVNDALKGEWRIWVRKKVKGVPPVLPLTERKTPFVTFLNLKGGVGKTFLAANLTAMLGLDGLWRGRSLLLDLDFQGTLSEGTLNRDQLGVMLKGDRSVRALWKMDRLDPNDLRQLTLPMNGCESVDVCPAENPLDEADYRAQTQHLLLDQENRFHFRQLLHQDWVYQQYGLVGFDCPPRLTASAINALAASDFIVIPTRLEPHAARAVPNTLVQIRALQKAGVISAQILGVIPNEVRKRGEEKNLIAPHQDAYATLNSNLEAYLPRGVLFPPKACAEGIPASELPGPEEFEIAAVQKLEVRQRLKETADEFARRLENAESYPITL